MQKITTLIPAYKTEYLSELLLALKTQTYKNFNVIISDDSPAGKITHLLQSEKYKPLVEGLDINLVQGPRQGGTKNFDYLLDIAESQNELLHVLCDDDIIYPKFYEYHAGIHQATDVACSVSRRWTSSAFGQPISGSVSPTYIEGSMERALILHSDTLFKSIVPDCFNWLGEYSNSVFKKKVLHIHRKKEMGGIFYEGLGDIGFYLNVSLESKLVFIQDYLGFFRLNPHQNTSQPDNPARKASYICWCALAIAALNIKKLSPEEAHCTFEKVRGMINNDYPQDNEMQTFALLFSQHLQLTDTLVKEFVKSWNNFLKIHYS